MRIVLILLLHVALFGQSYNFEEIKFISAVGTDFRKNGKIEINDKKVVITYEKPKFKQIVKEDNNITIKGSSGEIYKLKGKALYYTGLFIDIMTQLGSFEKIQSNRDFKVERVDNTFYLTFLGDMSDRVVKAEVKVKNSKVTRFKLFMPNEDTLTIVKK